MFLYNFNCSIIYNVVIVCVSNISFNLMYNNSKKKLVWYIIYDRTINCDTDFKIKYV